MDEPSRRDLQVGEIEAWRAWKIDDGRGPGLHSLSVPHTWAPGVNRALCFRWERCGIYPMPPASPDFSGFVSLCADDYADHSCGFYALADPAEVLHEYGASGRFNGQRVVLGRVALWGRVVEGRHGYRGEFAYPLGLCHEEDAGLDAMIDDLARVYDVPRIPHPCTKEAAA